MDELMDSVYRKEASLIAWLQNRFSDQSDFFSFISQVFTPGNIYVLFAPIFHSFDRNIGKRMLLTAVMSEWVYQLMKWSLRGDRPFWWVHEASLPKSIEIQQFSTTCESAPGNPSAHALCTTSVWFVIIKTFLENAHPRIKNKRMLRLLSWSTYVLIVATVILSRVYLASHFLHQCLLGLAMGCVVVVAMNRFPVDKMKMSHFALLSIGLFSTSVLVFLVLQATGRDPTWSIRKAVKSCARKDKVNVYAPAFDAVMRYCGIALGTGLGLTSALYRKSSWVKFTTAMKISCALLSLGLIKVCEFVVISKFKVYQSHITIFCFNVTVSYLFIAVAPFIVSKIYSTVKHKFKVS